jgi:hypothetical protein
MPELLIRYAYDEKVDIDLRGHFTGKFDSHEIAAVKYQLTAKNSVAASAQSATG